MQELQYDVVSTQARDLLTVFLPHLPQGPIKQRLADWDFSYAPGSLEATLFTKLYRNVLLEIFGEARTRRGRHRLAADAVSWPRGSVFR